MAKDNQSNATTSDEAKQELNALIRRVTARFLVPPEGDVLLSDFCVQLNSVTAPYDEVGKAFKANIQGLLSTVSIPYALAHASALDRHFQRLHSAERIRAQIIDGEQGESNDDLEARRERTALDKARARMTSFVDSVEGRDALIRDSLTFLERSLREESFAEATDELVLQGLVLGWGAFEVFARDSFVALLNSTPRHVETLLKDPVAKRRFELAKISIDTLAANDFDLSGKMGAILAKQQDLSDLQSIKAVYGALFPNNDGLRDALSNSKLRTLAQRRHLVVHRRGLIDETFLKTVSSTQKCGERLKVSPDDLEKNLQSCIGAATAILKAIQAGSGSAKIAG